MQIGSRVKKSPLRVSTSSTENGKSLNLFNLKCFDLLPLDKKSASHRELFFANQFQFQKTASKFFFVSTIWVEPRLLHLHRLRLEWRSDEPGPELEGPSLKFLLTWNEGKAWPSWRPEAFLMIKAHLGPKLGLNQAQFSNQNCSSYYAALTKN